MNRCGGTGEVYAGNWTGQPCPGCDGCAPSEPLAAVADSTVVGAPGTWVDILSSTIARVRYTPTTMVMTVRFQGGLSYDYDGVPAFKYEGLLSARSPGSYLATNIKGSYPAARVDE